MTILDWGVFAFVISGAIFLIVMAISTWRYR